MSRPRKDASTSDMTKEKAKDRNAPRGPPNAYTIFYKHFHSEYQRKNPNSNIDGRKITELVAQAWRSLTDDEKKPFQERSAAEREKYTKEMDAYKKSDNYKKFVAENKSLSKLGEIEVFSKEFMAFNKSRETELRALRRQISIVEDQIAHRNDSIDVLKKKLDHSYKSLLPAKKVTFEKERQLLIWCREMVCALDKAELLDELKLNYNSPPEKIIQVIEEASSDPKYSSKIQKLFSGFVLEIF